MNMIKKILIGLVAVFALLQLFQPEKNDSGDTEYAIANSFEVPAEVDIILKNACNDCHSNTTNYPWYGHVQPVAWWVNDHISHGKSELNFSEFTKRRLAVQKHKFDEIAEEVEEGKMPLDTYTKLGRHPKANLSAEEKDILVNWAKQKMAEMDAKYPADSLILKRN